MRSRSTGRVPEVSEVYPRRCPAGHDWRRPRSMSPGWDGTTRTWRCATCAAVILADGPPEYVRTGTGALVLNPVLAGVQIPAACPEHGPDPLFLDEALRVVCDRCGWREPRPATAEA